MTNISCNLAGDPQVKVAIYDAAGRLVRSLSGSGGERRLSWDGTDNGGRRLPAGTYFCKMKTGDLSLTRKVILLE
jgi:flagellar hook assembly protein FlgD